MKIRCVQFLGSFQKLCSSGLSFVQWTRSSNNSLSLGFKRCPIWFRERRKGNSGRSDIHKRYFPEVRDTKAVKKKNAQCAEVRNQRSNAAGINMGAFSFFDRNSWRNVKWKTIISLSNFGIWSVVPFSSLSSRYAISCLKLLTALPTE